MCSDDVICEVAAVEAVCEGLLAEAEEENSNIAYYRKKRATALDDPREQFWQRVDHSNWRYWFRDRNMNELHNIKTYDKLNRKKRQLGLLQPIFMTPNRYADENMMNTKENDDKGEYIGVLIELITRSLGTDISFNRFANFLSNLKKNDGGFATADFMTSFSREFGEGKARELRELAIHKFGHEDIFSTNSSSSTFSSSSNSFSSSTETSLSPEHIEIIKRLFEESKKSIQGDSESLAAPPNINELPQGDQADFSISEHALKIQGLQKVVQSITQNTLKVKFQIQGMFKRNNNL